MTYATANVVDVIADGAEASAATKGTAKFIAVTAANMSASIAKVALGP